MAGFINALLFLQIAHFFVAYFLLKHIVLKPGLKVIRSIDDADRAMQRDLTLLHEEVELQDAMVKEQWSRHCHVLRSRIPLLVKARVLPIKRQSKPLVTRLSDDDEKRLITDVKNVIVNVVEKGRS
ncbi:MAG: hypothetical protein UV38_C0003G0074 [candidate division TM6 bacterium GW2011_GWE2_42_60]|nr:MAG: hypothetical protein UV38_C0003G0074 [candidate division TM6 bacterium GW2011_GWE2_42_60]HBY05446.1 hypothetical protein [Candidatus Dependentiae bacterium]